MSTDPDSRCPCQSGLALSACCGPLLSGEQQANTAEALMRSRYSAFSLGLADYLYRTLHPSQRTDNELAQLQLSIRQTQWINLEILSREQGHLNDNEGYVTFRATFIQGTQPGSLNERSHFIKENGYWYYVNGDARFEEHQAKDPLEQPPGRNAPCWCGSGKKFKKCHGR